MTKNNDCSFDLKLFILKLRFEKYKNDFNNRVACSRTWDKITEEVNEHFQSALTAKQTITHLSWCRRLYDWGLKCIRLGKEPPQNWDIVRKYYTSDDDCGPVKPSVRPQTRFLSRPEIVWSKEGHPDELKSHIAAREWISSLKELEATIDALCPF